MPGEDDIDFAIRRHAEQQNTKSESIESVVPADRSVLNAMGLRCHSNNQDDALTCVIFVFLAVLLFP